MKAAAFRLGLDAAHRATGYGVFTTNMLTKSIMAGEHPRACEKTIAVAVRDGVLIALCRGVYEYRYAKTRRPVLQEAVLRLRPRAFNYISLETALSCWGVIEQHALGVLTVMTSGRSQRFETPYGAIHLTHTDKTFDAVLPHLVMADDSDVLFTALPALAAKDLIRVGRNTDLLDMEELAAVEKEMSDAV